MENVIFVSLRMIHVGYSVIVLIKVSQCYVPSMVKDAIVRILEKMTTRMLSNLSSLVYADCKLKHKLSSTPFIFSISNKLFMRTLLRHSSQLGQPRVFIKALFANKFCMVPFNQSYLSYLLLTTCRRINYKGLFFPSQFTCQNFSLPQGPCVSSVPYLPTNTGGILGTA